MNLAISNIAWEKHDDPKVLELLRANGVTGIEVAPTKVWQGWENANQQTAEIYRRQMADEGFELPAMQAILFGKPELQLFQPRTHNDFLEHFKLVADLAAGLGSNVLVLGAPKNRRRGQISISQANEIAADFLYKAAVICDERGCSIGLEHNPAEYGCDYITNVADARELVNLVNHPGLQLHLDSAGIHMCGGDIVEVIKSAGVFVHYHISEPMLEPIYGGEVDHSSALQSLAECRYEKWVSIEMKKPQKTTQVLNSISYIKSLWK